MRDQRYYLTRVLLKWQYASYEFHEDDSLYVVWSDNGLNVSLAVNNESNLALVTLSASKIEVPPSWRTIAVGSNQLEAPYMILNRKIRLYAKPSFLGFDRPITFDPDLQTAITYAIRRLRTKGVTW